MEEMRAIGEFLAFLGLRANLRSKAGDVQGAVKAPDRSADLYSGDFQTYYLRAKAYVAGKRMEEGGKDLLLALRMDSNPRFVESPSVQIVPSLIAQSKAKGNGGRTQAAAAGGGDQPSRPARAVGRSTGAPSFSAQE
jgi:hypothetical protein